MKYVLLSALFGAFVSLEIGLLDLLQDDIHVDGAWAAYPLIAVFFAACHLAFEAVRFIILYERT